MGTGDPDEIYHRKILRLPIMALWDLVQGEIADNPVLEVLEAEPPSNLLDSAVPAPDAAIVPLPNDDCTVRVFDEWAKSLRMDPCFTELLDSEGIDPKVRAYVQGKYQLVRRLIDAITMRRDVLVRVIRAIGYHQRPFLIGGAESIQPLDLPMIAEEARVSVTTIKAAVEGKWLQAPHGFVLLEHFVNGSGGTKNGDL